MSDDQNAGSGGPGTERGDGVSRRDFLRVGGLSVVGLSQAALARGTAAFSHRRAILILMTGGPSQLETFDPKPDAPSAIRGPFSSIETAVPGLRFSKTLPLLAQRADRLAVIRSLAHDSAPIHETGQQLLQTGRLSTDGLRFPHWGSVVASRSPAPSRSPALSRSSARSPLPACSIVNGPLSETGVRAYRGQEAGLLGSEWEPVLSTLDLEEETEAIQRLYGASDFGRLLLRSRQLVEKGTRCVTVNLFDSLHQRLTWDCHGDKHCGPATLMNYQDRLCPEFDRALAGLLDDLAQRGLLDDTLVIATGEFGRTPKVNDNQGRDHWPGCWSGVIAGGKLTGGAVLGASDATASEPLDRPVSPGELTATLVAWCGVDVAPLKTTIDKTELPLIPFAPLAELWG
jgi:uncharacterized protein (DUF1501 family)